MTGLKVEYDAGAQMEALGQVLLPIRSLLDAHGPTLGTELVDRFRGAEQRLKQRLARPFNLVVVGEFKRGKSSLVNALVHQELVGTHVAPETVLVQEIHHADQRQTLAFLTDGGKVDLGAEIIDRVRLEELAGELPAPIDRLRIAAPLPWGRDMIITDTPGTGDLMERFDERVQGYLPEADAVFYVISALSPLSAAERNFLELSLRPMELSKVTFVLNMIDSLPSEEDAERVLARVREKLSQGFPDSPVIAVSALDAIMRQAGEGPAVESRADELGRRFGELEEHLRQAVMLNQDMDRLANGVREARNALDVLAGDLQSLDFALGQSQDELLQSREALSQRDPQLESQLARLRSAHKKQIALGKSWLEGFVDRLEVELLRGLEGLKHEFVQKHLPLFLNDRLRVAWTAVLETHRGRLVDALMEELEASQLSCRSASGVEQAAGAASFRPPDLTQTAGVLVGLQLLSGFLANPGALIVGLMTVLGAVDRGKGDQERAQKYREHLTHALPELRVKLLEAHEAAARELLKSATALLQEESGSRRARELEAKEQALELRKRDAAAIEQERSALRELVRRVSLQKDRLEELSSNG